MKTTIVHAMRQLTLTPLLVALLALLAPSLWPTVAAHQPNQKSVAGTYELSFLTSGSQPIDSTLFVGEELILKAHVEDRFQSPAVRGSVTFQVCSRRGGRSLSQMDPAPSRECDVEGTGSWLSLITMKVDGGSCPNAGPGNACVNFGYISSPRTIGFRFRYAEQGSGIASAISQPKDASWVLP